MSGEGRGTLKYCGSASELVQKSAADGSTVPPKQRFQREKSFIKPKVRDSSKRRSVDYGGSTNITVGRPKPTRELYRPPPINSLNPAAKEFAPITPSKSFDSGYKGPQDNINLNRTGLTITVPGRQTTIFKSRSISSNISLDRSCELRGQLDLSSGQIDLSRGPHDLQKVDLNLFSFPLEVVSTLNRALEDPNRVPSRSLMELVKQIINRVISAGGSGQLVEDSQRITEQGSKLCMSIIEREEKETFLESLINTCQELYHDRERLLRGDVKRWNAYISFLNQMYALLKRKQLHFLTRYAGVAPKLVLLSLLAECCTATLTSNLKSVQEVETMFLVLTHIGKDLEAETPGRMSLLVTCLREAFLSSNLQPQISKTLLQLIELRAADWNLPAQAVMYYYPGSSA